MIQDVPFNSYEVFKIQANCPKSIHGTKDKNGFNVKSNYDLTMNREQLLRCVNTEIILSPLLYI